MGFRPDRVVRHWHLATGTGTGFGLILSRLDIQRRMTTSATRREQLEARAVASLRQCVASCEGRQGDWEACYS